MLSSSAEASLRRPAMTLGWARRTMGALLALAVVALAAVASGRHENPRQKLALAAARVRGGGGRSAPPHSSLPRHFTPSSPRTALLCPPASPLSSPSLSATTPTTTSAPLRPLRAFSSPLSGDELDSGMGKNGDLEKKPKRMAKVNEAAIIAARSGGRVGGSVRGSRSAPSSSRRGRRPPPSRSRSNRLRPSSPPPQRGSIRPGYGPGGPGYGGGPSVYINPYPSPFFSPFFNPFFGGYGGIGFATPLPLNILALGALGLVAFRSLRSQAAFLEASTGTVLMLQVAVYCNDRGPNSLFGRLNSLANSADTWSEEGLRNLVQESTLALLRSEEDWVAGRSETYQKGMLGSTNDVDSAFNQALLKERAKFEDENISGRKSAPRIGGSGKNTYMVVTILVALRDAPSLPNIRGLEEMRAALAQTSARASIEENLLAAEVLWTPEDPGEILEREEMFLKFPELTDL